VQPRRARGVFWWTGGRASSPRWFCLTPALWWGDGVSEAMVQQGCAAETKSMGWGWNFSFTCEGAAVGSPDCLEYAKKKAGQKRRQAP